jgi:TRAP-type C4-dicarboxylate transport system substrate-binding protein
MMKNSRCNFILVVLLAIFLSVGSVTSLVTKAEAAEWAMYTIMPAAGYFGQGFAMFSKMVEEKSASKLKIKVHFGGALGFKDSELLPVIKKRMIDVCELQLFKNDGAEKFLSLNSLPYICKDFGETYLLDLVARPYYEKIVARWDGKLLFTFPFMPSQIHAKKQINSLQDIAGAKIRVYDKNTSDAMLAIGAAPVTIPWAEVYTSLQRGVVDAVITSNMSACDAHMWEVLKVTNVVNSIVPVSSVVINQKSWQELPDDLKLVVLEAGKKMEDWFWYQSQSMQAKNAATLRENGMQIYDVPQPVYAEMVQKTKHMWDSWIEKTGPDGKLALDEFQRLTGKIK